MRNERLRDGATVPAPGELAATDRMAAISHAITAMRQELGAPHHLRDIARTALMSPFHFHRVFRQLTAATPGRFLTAMRMAEAKRLLLESTLSATDIGFTVGYSSVGTFTTQFTRLVGVPPGRFRAVARPIRDVRMGALVEHRLPVTPRPNGRAAPGWLSTRPDGTAGITFVAAFPAGMPQQRPLACAILTSTGALRLPEPDAGAATVLAVSVRRDATVGQVLTGSPAAGMFVGGATAARGAEAPTGCRYGIRLRAPRMTDPPLLLAYPLMIGRPLGPDARWNR